MNYVKVTDMEYKRVLKEDVIASIEKCISQVENAKSASDLLNARLEYNKDSELVGTMVRLAHTRLNLNSRDEFYSAEMDYYNQALPEIQMYDIKFSKAFLASPYLEEAKKELNPLIITMMELSLKTADERILEEMQEENKLTTEYGKFVSELTYDFRGEKVTLGILRKYIQDNDRETRKEATNALGKTLKANSEYIDTIFDKMVKNRDKMAKKLGYKSYVELGYNIMQRTSQQTHNGLATAGLDGIDTGFLAAAQHSKGLLLGKIGFHIRIHFRGHVGLAGKGIASCNQTGNVMITDFHSRQHTFVLVSFKCMYGYFTMFPKTLSMDVF